MHRFFQSFFNALNQYNTMVNDYQEVKDQATDHGMAHFQWGLKLIELEEYEAAIEKLEQAIQMDGTQPEYWMQLALAHHKLFHPEEARTHLKKAIELNPALPESHLLMATILLESDAPLQQAQDYFDQAVALTPYNSQLYTQWGMALTRAKRYEDAISQFRRALRLKPNQPSILLLWGMVLIETRQLDEALTIFQRVVQIDPQSTEAFHCLSVTLNQLGRPEEAIEQARNALHLENDRAEVYVNLGQALAKVGKPDVAYSNFKHALMLQANDIDALYHWGMVLLEDHKPTEALEKLEKALKALQELSQPDWSYEALVQAAMGKAYHQTGDLKKAEDALAAASEKDPTQTHWLVDWAQVLIAQNNPSPAIEALFSVADNPAVKPQVHLLLAKHFMAEGDLSQAKKHLAELQDSDPKHRDGIRLLCEVLFQGGETQQAVRTLRPLLKTHPDDMDLVCDYVTYLIALGDVELAQQKLLEAHQRDPVAVLPMVMLAERCLVLVQPPTSETLAACEQWITLAEKAMSPSPADTALLTRLSAVKDQWLQHRELSSAV